MNNAQRRRMDKFERERVFMIDNAADFPEGSVGDFASLSLIDLIGEIKTFDAEQTSGEDDATQDFSVEATRRDGRTR